MVSSQVLCHDILSKIFEHLEPGGVPHFDEFPAVISERQLRQYTLAASARVCRSFTAPALDVLWRHMCNFNNLLCLFSTYSSTECNFVGAIAEKEWQRFQEYAPRIRGINGNFGKNPGSPLQEQVWMVLLQKSQGSPLLPRLEYLTINGSLGGLMSLLGPTVYNVNLYIPLPSVNARDSNLLVDTFRPHLSHIKTLVIYEYVPNASGPRRGINIPKSIDVCALTHLESLDVVYPVIARRSMIQALMGFPNLRFLCLSFEFCADERTSLQATKFEPGFFELRHMDLTASYDDLALFLEMTNPPQLETLALAREFERGDDPDVDDLPRAYAKLPPHLRCLSLRFYVSPGDPDAPDSRYTSPLLTPSRVLPPSLCALDNLREVLVRFQNISCPLENAVLAALCTAWPALERFEYNSVLYHDDDPSMVSTLDTLLAFARAHPRLTRLSLPGLSPDGIPDDIGALDAGALRDWPGHGLRLFRLKTYLVGTPLVSLARAVDRAFPELDLGPVRAAKVDSDGEATDLLALPLLVFQMSRRPGAAV
ncbi:uncharacterized protein TRAVEDRAFT_74323 [Trametes versicolor FP-101664 SS1]|uniref:uncharacterized protein n=1 Tax=Trametes versicolor (strain FP-101664) TaxID=717944 RepID=UPI00046220C2|nr:uncharacterized protein TRAVEDRAFT_74323 [Trametes versicolor FP-101664 SS1]EIW54027.1 hypothetical protein TRAVEDRAFT_74323 [Trametes versicolor FP-101664 SS1]